MRNPLMKRLPREFIGEMGKYLVIFLFMTATIGFVSGFLVAGGSMIQAYEESFEKYKIEDGHFVLLKESSPFREPLKLKMPVGSGHDETDGG